MTSLLGCGDVPVENGTVDFRDVGLWMVKQLTESKAAGATNVVTEKDSLQRAFSVPAPEDIDHEDQGSTQSVTQQQQNQRRVDQPPVDQQLPAAQWGEVQRVSKELGQVRQDIAELKQGMEIMHDSIRQLYECLGPVLASSQQQQQQQQQEQ